MIAAGVSRRDADGARRRRRRRARSAGLRGRDRRPDPVRPRQQWRRRLCRRARAGGEWASRCASRRWRSRRPTRRSAARAAWAGPVEPLAEATPAPVLVDALFGTGLTRPLDADARRARCARQRIWPRAARLSRSRSICRAASIDRQRPAPIGEALSTPPLRPHARARRGEAGAPPPARRALLRRRSASLDIGVPIASQADVLDSPAPPDPRPGLRTNIPAAWSRSSAARCPAPPTSRRCAAMRAGAGYVTAARRQRKARPHALVRTPFSRPTRSPTTASARS